MVDHYETMQISANAEPETIHRVYRLLAQRYHPDNKDTGNATRFRALNEAYENSLRGGPPWPNCTGHGLRAERSRWHRCRVTSST